MSIYQNILINILGHLSVLQSLASVVSPLHGFPPYCGAGFAHVLMRFCSPPPQVTVQVPQSDQSPN